MAYVVGSSTEGLRRTSQRYKPRIVQIKAYFNPAMPFAPPGKASPEYMLHLKVVCFCTMMTEKQRLLANIQENKAMRLTQHVSRHPRKILAASDLELA